MNDLMYIGLWLFLVVHGLLYLGSSFRLHQWSANEDEDLITGIPLMFLFFAFWGSVFTVGFAGMTSLLAPPLIGLVWARGKLRFQKPQFHIRFHVAAFLSCALFFFFKISTLFDFSTGIVKSTFHDDYSYIQQINLLESQRTESYFMELARSAFYLEPVYKIYHLTEFYFLLFFKKMAVGLSYHWFHFFLKPLLNVFAVMITASFFASRSRNTIGYPGLFLLVVVLYTTLRFNLLDDFLRTLIPSDYWKAVFFQNYYFPSPMSYHVSYKVSLVFLFVLPVLWLYGKAKWPDLFLFSAIASLVSIAFLPLTCMIAGIRMLLSWFPKLWVNPLLLAASLVLFLGGFFISGTPFSQAPSYVFQKFFQGFNLVFENFYWHLFCLSGLCLLGSKSLKIRLLSLLLLAFPLIYLQPGILFKVFSIAIISILGYSVFRRNSFFNNPIPTTFLPALLVLYFLVPFLNTLPNVEQVFSNLLFPLLVIAFVQFILHFKVPLKPVALGFLAINLFFLNVPAVRYDNATPLHVEKIPAEFFRESVFKQPWVNILSISKYSNFPFFDAQQLGNGILDRVDNVAISMGGFEQFSPEERKKYESIPFGRYLLRIPDYEYRLIRNGSLDGFLDTMQVKVVLLENTPQFAHFKTKLAPRILRTYYEPKKKYWIFVLKPRGIAGQ